MTGISVIHPAHSGAAAELMTIMSTIVDQVGSVRPTQARRAEPGLTFWATIVGFCERGWGRR